MVVLMMCFNLFSHGTQDLYPTFLQKQHNFDPATVSWIAIVANLGAIVGGLSFGHLSEKIGRVNAITIAALIALPALPLWAFSSTPVHAGDRRLHHAGRGAGRLGRDPGPSQRIVAGRGARHHSGLRLPGRQFPRLLQRPVPGLRSPRRNGGDYAFALALVAGVVAVAIVIVIRFSPERRGELLVAH